MFTLLSSLVCFLVLWQSGIVVAVDLPVDPGDPQVGPPEDPSGNQTCDGQYRLKCLDEQTLAVCADRLVASEKCSTLFNNRPCCVDGACVAGTCGRNASILCTDTNYFPDPDSCRKYHICPLEGKASFPVDCPANYVYDSRLDRCRVPSNAQDCATINCAKNQNRFVLHPTDRSVMAYCGSDETLLYRCPDRTNTQYSLDTLTCTYICRQAGLFADVSDCQSYYECYWDNRRLVSRHLTCPGDMEFDNSKKVCVLPKTPCTAQVAAFHLAVRSAFTKLTEQTP